MATIMVVDDTAFMRMILRDVLEKGGHEIICTASDGMEAIKQYKVWQPDLVVMDVLMPIMGGLEASEKIIALYPKAKIIMCSAQGRRSIIVDSLIIGAIDFIIKPFQGERILKAVNKVTKGVSI